MDKNIVEVQDLRDFLGILCSIPISISIPIPISISISIPMLSYMSEFKSELI